MTPTAPRNKPDAYSHMEAQVSGVAASLEGFIKESREFRDRTEREQTNIWAAIREQGDNLRNAVEKLSANGRIGWPMIISTVTAILAITTAGASVGYMLMESRIKQTEIRQEYHERMLTEYREEQTYNHRIISKP